jgi:hypothetical protein
MEWDYWIGPPQGAYATHPPRNLHLLTWNHGACTVWVEIIPKGNFLHVPYGGYSNFSFRSLNCHCSALHSKLPHFDTLHLHEFNSDFNIHNVLLYLITQITYVRSVLYGLCLPYCRIEPGLGSMVHYGGFLGGR